MGWPLSPQPGRSQGRDGAGKVPFPLGAPWLLRGSGHQKGTAGLERDQEGGEKPKPCPSALRGCPAAEPRGLGSCFSSGICELSHKVVSETAGIGQDKSTA